MVCAEDGPALRYDWQTGKRYVMSVETSKQMVASNLPSEANHGGETEKREFSFVSRKRGQQAGCELEAECLSVKYDMSGDSSYSLDSSTDQKKMPEFPSPP
jgi:hypothetical protein